MDLDVAGRSGPRLGGPRKDGVGEGFAPDAVPVSESDELDDLGCSGRSASVLARCAPKTLPQGGGRGRTSSTDPARPSSSRARTKRTSFLFAACDSPRGPDVVHEHGREVDSAARLPLLEQLSRRVPQEFGGLLRLGIVRQRTSGRRRCCCVAPRRSEQPRRRRARLLMRRVVVARSQEIEHLLVRSRNARHCARCRRVAIAASACAVECKRCSASSAPTSSTRCKT